MFTKRAERVSRSQRTAHRAGRWAALCLGLAAAVGAATYVLVRLAEDPRLCARISQVSGAHHTSLADVVAAASVTGCENAWFLNRRAVAARLETLPWVKRAEVRLAWPAELQVQLTEREPAAVVVFAPSTSHVQAALIDATQRVLAIEPRGGVRLPSGLPRLRVPAHGSGVRVGATLRDPDVAQARDALERLRALGLAVTDVSIDPATGIGVTADRQLHVLIGQPTDFTRKAFLFLRIAERIQRPQRVAYIDLRSVAAPTILYRGGGVRE